MKVNNNMDLKLTVCLVFTRCSIMCMSRRFGEKFCLLLQGDCVRLMWMPMLNGVKFKKTIICVTLSMKISKPISKLIFF
jgi:hypothetical protein